jgi:hypothetical protein
MQERSIHLARTLLEIHLTEVVGQAGSVHLTLY